MAKMSVVSYISEGDQVFEDIDTGIDMNDGTVDHPTDRNIDDNAP